MVRPAPFFKAFKIKVMIKVKWLKAHSKFAYAAGDVGFVTPGWAEKLLPGGYIIPLPGEDTDSADDKKDPVNDLPADLPGRTKLFEAGFTELAKIKEAGDSLLDIGLSKGTVTKIKNYLKDK